MAYRFLLNRNNVEENVPPGELLLDIIRQNRGLTGTKEACRDYRHTPSDSDSRLTGFGDERGIDKNR